MATYLLFALIGGFAGYWFGRSDERLAQKEREAFKALDSFIRDLKSGNP